MRKFIILLSVIVAFASSHSGSSKFISIEPIPSPKFSAPIAAHWDNPTNSLFFCNAFASSPSEPLIFRYDYNQNVVYGATIVGINTLSIGFILPILNNKKNGDLFAIGVNKDVITIKWDGVSPVAVVYETVFSLDVNIPTSLVGYARSAPNNRFFGGTYSAQYCNSSTAGSLSFYRYGKPPQLVQLFSGLTLTGGIAFDENAGIMYHLDSCNWQITAFDHNPVTGDICNARVVFNLNSILTSTLSSPLGLGIDTNGNLYTASQAGNVYVINPWKGVVINVVNMPVPGASGLFFGGPNHDILYVLSAGNIIDFSTGQSGSIVSDGPSLYAVRGLHAQAFQPTRLDFSWH